MRSNLNDGSNGTPEDNDLLAEGPLSARSGPILLTNLRFDALTKRGEDGAPDDGVFLKALTRH